MRRPKYFVSFGGFNLQNVTNVHDENGRELSEYDSVGAGKFNVPDARKPHTWKIDCDLREDPPAAADSWRASEIFKAMEALLNNSADPSRLVITNSAYPAANLSVLAWFKSYAKDEVGEGQYKTVVELEEYIPVGVKTTDVPYVARPGKVPVPPKVTVTAAKSTYAIKKGYAPQGNSMADLRLADSKTNKPVTNDAAVPKNATLLCGSYVVRKSTTTTTTSAYPTVPQSQQDNVFQSWFKSAGDAISKAFTSWQNDAANKKIETLK